MAVAEKRASHPPGSEIPFRNARYTLPNTMEVPNLIWPEGPSWEFTQDLRIGALDGPPEYQFGRIGGFQVLSDGRIVVTDVLEHHLRFFSPDGVHERTVGREGQGPGEFGGGGMGLFLGPGDTLVVSDGANARMNVFAPDGTWLEDFSTLPSDGYRIGYWSNNPPTGRIATIHDPLRQADGARTDTLDIVLERDVHGGTVDTLLRVRSRYSMSRSDPGTFRTYYGSAWWHRPWGDGLLTARTDEYRLPWYGQDGALSRIISLAREPLALTDEDQSVFIGRWEATFKENRVPADRASELLAGIRFADNYPPFRWFSHGPAGTLLVQRVGPVRDLDEDEQEQIRLNVMNPPGGSAWDVFDSEGRYLGAVVIPETARVSRVSPLKFFRDPATDQWYMYSIWSDELDVQYIVRWRIDGRMPECGTDSRFKTAPPSLSDYPPGWPSVAHRSPARCGAAGGDEGGGRIDCG